MGEYADEIIENILSGLYDDWGQEDGYYCRSPECQRCKKPGLEWRMTPRGWRLHEYDPYSGDMVIHVCDRPTYGVDLSGFLKTI